MSDEELTIFALYKVVGYDTDDDSTDSTDTGSTAVRNTTNPDVL